MKSILACVLALSFLTLVALCLLIVNYKNKKIKTLDKRVEKTINVMSFFSAIFTILTLIISVFGLLMQIKSPKLQIEIYTIHEMPWEEENEGRKLYLLYDDDGHVNFDMFAPSIWHLHIKNEGNQYAENVKIKIRFEDFAFVPQPDSFTLSDFNYGMGSYCVLERTYDNIIQPGETVEVPYFPFENAELCELYNPNHTYMNIEVYENSSLVLKDDIFIEIADNPMIEDTCILDTYVSDEDEIVRAFNEYYFDYENYRFECDLDLNLMEIYPQEPAFSLEEHEKAYKHYLNLINTYNPSIANIYGKLAVFYGRLYYRKLAKEISGIDVEQAIENDLAIRWKYGKY